MRGKWKGIGRIIGASIGDNIGNSIGDDIDDHEIIDLGADEYTRGRPHPMIEPGVREDPLSLAMADPQVGVVLVDVVIGYGSHEDPAGRLVAALGGDVPDGPAVIASVCGTEADPQKLSDQVDTLRAAGVVVAASNAEASEPAASILSCVFVSKSLASCRSRSCSCSSPRTRLTMRPRFTVSRL